MRTPEQIIGKDRLLQLIFEGYVVVPAKPTVEMLVAAYQAVGVPEHPILARSFEAMTNAFGNGQAPAKPE